MEDMKELCDIEMLNISYGESFEDVLMKFFMTKTFFHFSHYNLDKLDMALLRTKDDIAEISEKQAMNKILYYNNMVILDNLQIEIAKDMIKQIFQSEKLQSITQKVLETEFLIKMQSVRENLLIPLNRYLKSISIEELFTI